jgi:DNA-binding NarL/FixJ family response regulator
VLLIEDHAVMRDGLRMMLEAVGIRVVGEAADAAHALAAYASCHPDIVLLDIRLGAGPDGIDVAASLKNAYPACKIIMFASDALEADIHRAREAGACGFLVKTMDRVDIIRAIHAAHEKGVCQPYDHQAHGPHEPLSEREREVLDLLRGGLTSAEIGRVLHLSEHTIKSHLKSMFAKLHAADRTEAVATGYQLGYLRVR